MYSINFMGLVFVSTRSLWHATGNLLLLATTAWLFVFTSEMALRTGFTCLDDPGVAGNLAFLSFVGRLSCVIGYMSFEQVSAVQ